jgi:transposase
MQGRVNNILSSGRDLMKYVGIDVSKDKFDVFILPDKKHFIIGNDPASIKKFSTEVEKLNPELVAMESSGGYENKLAITLLKAGVKTAVVNPLLIKNYGKSFGARAKTDKLDSALIAHFAQERKPKELELVSESEQEMDNFVTRRRQLIEIKTAESNRLKLLQGKLAEDIREHLDWLEKKLIQIDDYLKEHIEQSEHLKHNGEIMRSVPGVGKVLTSTLLMQLPEIGKVSSKKISALVGLAPFNRDSGILKGQMKIRGGRKEVRSALYMPAWSAVKHNPVFKAYYQKLINKGKKKKVAITACMHKLLIIINSLVKQDIKWNPDYQKANI